MKFLHTADLHIGKSIYEFNMLEDQRHILQEILQIAGEEKVDAILLAGDIYDRSVPSTEAVQLLEWFLMEALKIAPVFMISGNHDSAERLSFGAGLFEKNGLYIVGGKDVKEVFLQDEYGKVAVHMLPFVKPAVVGAANCEEAVAKQLEQWKENWNADDRHVLMTHFFVCAGGKEPELSDSEVRGFVGGLEQVDVDLFRAYDYVALGHIHKPQAMKRGQTYYAGSPLCYSFSECTAASMSGKKGGAIETNVGDSNVSYTNKGVNIIDLGAEGAIGVYRKILHPRRHMRILRGSLAELVRQGNEAENGREDYIQAILTDKDELIDPIGTLRSVYPNTMQIILEKRLALGGTPLFHGAGSRAKTMEELFSDFYENLAREPMDAERIDIVREVAEEIEGKSL
ncbi:MAG: exonuclease SbcCD subunit D [Lachnospiraceae bacterium]|nr:exonuclease SbcCD subunit D [Lachnospiraceae bacterium]